MHPLSRYLLPSALLFIAGCPSYSGDAPATTSPGTAFDVDRYALQGQFDWDRGRLVAAVDVDLRVTGKGLGSVTLDSAVDVKNVEIGGEAVPFQTDTEKETLTIDVSGRHAMEGEALTLHIDYEAAAGPSLVALPVRRGDPLAVRALYTFSEPDGAHNWMPCHDVPSDRAVFSADLLVPAGEKLIANGDLVSDTPEGSGHRVKYQTGYTLPPYLMAFAISDFEVETAMHGELPIAIWHRRGLPGDHAGMLTALDRAIGTFEKLLVPYPFEKYAIVALPEFPGGMEHAGITFQGEDSLQPSISGNATLMAHELGHQWFGDLVTVATWDDVWIKEGMATLLQSEAIRGEIDESAAGTLDGDQFYPFAGEAIRDRELAPGEKYTSGPYSRAAWLLTQIRSVVGERTFWSTLRGVLDAHRFGTVGTEDMITAFAPALGPSLTARARVAIDAKALPVLTVTPAADGASVTLQDPDGSLVAPFDVRWISPSGASREVELTANQPVTLAPQGDEYLVLDPRDIHPDWSMFLDPSAGSAAYDTQVAPLLVPASDADATSFLGLAGPHQMASLEQGILPLSPGDFAGFLQGLHAEPAKGFAIASACTLATAGDVDPATRASWADAIKAGMTSPPLTWGVDMLGAEGFAACHDLVAPEQLFAGEFQRLASDPSVSGAGEARLRFLSELAVDPSLALATWGSVARGSNSLSARRLAIRVLSSELSSPDAALLPDYRALFVDVVAHSEVDYVLAPAIRGLVKSAAPTAAENQAGLDALAAVLASPVTAPVHARAVCAAHRLTMGDEAAFTAFGDRLAGAPLSPGAQAALKDPSTCR